ncbi:MAG: aromatic amino acid lyase [Thermoleophilia bacterium]
MTVVLTARAVPEPVDVERIAYGESVELAPDALERIAAGHRATARALASGGRVYGVTTGQGYLADRDLDDEEVARHQRDLLVGRAVGSAPWLPPAEARAIMAVRLARFAGGAAGVSPELCRVIAARLNDGFTPAVPRTGIGCAGEVIPLSHAFQTLAGLGRVLDGDGVEDAATALARRGAEPYAPRAKEGIALLAGSPGVTALAICRRRSASRLAALMTWGAACAADAAGVPLDALSAAVGRLGPDRVLAAVCERLGDLLEGAAGPRRLSQGPVSFRIAPQVLAHLRRTVDRLGEDAALALAAPDDSPALIDGAFTSTGTFHEIGLAAGMDALTAALVRAAEASAQRSHRLLDGRVTGLPDQLTPRPGPRCGLVVLHKRAVGAVHDLRRLAVPASVGLMDTSLGQEDAQTFGFASAEALRAAEGLTAEVLAIELIHARQAWALRGTRPAPGLAPLAGAVAAAVPPVDEDRPLGPDVDRVRDLLAGIALPGVPAP